MDEQRYNNYFYYIDEDDHAIWFYLTDGENSGQIRFRDNYADINAVVNRINSRISANNIEAYAEVVDTYQWRIVSNAIGSDAYLETYDHGSHINWEGYYLVGSNGNVISNGLEQYPWSWNFEFPEGEGYYEFFSIGAKDGHYEDVKTQAESSVAYFEEPRYFIFQIDTNLDCTFFWCEENTFTFRADNAISLFIDWGDGTNDIHHGSGPISHTYSEAGIYNISLQGKANNIRFGSYLVADAVTPQLLVDILTPISYGISGMRSAWQMFRGTSNFGIYPLTAPDFFDEVSGRITTLSVMFHGSSFNQDISNWNTSNVESIDSMFSYSQFNQDINSWDVSNVTNMFATFHTSQFNQSIGNWNTSSVTNMMNMFYDSQFNQDINSWDVSNVIEMWGMFANSQFNQDISSWDVSGVWSMYEMFANSQFNQDISSWDVSQVTDFEQFLYNSSMSRENYDALLIGWNNLSLQEYLFFGANGLEFCDGEAARASIMSNYNWNFIGDNKNCP